MKVELKRINDAVHLEGSTERGNTVSIDGSPAIGGQDLGARPMELLLAALGSCSSMDVLSILAKQKQPVQGFAVEVDGKRKDGAVPAVFTDIHVHFKLTGELDAGKVERAIELSLGTYCSVSKMIDTTAKITSSFSINES